MEGGENHEPPRFCIEANVPRGGWMVAVLRLHHGATLQNAVEATVDLHCKTVCLNQLCGDVNIFIMVLCFTIYICLKFTEEGPPLPLKITVYPIMTKEKQLFRNVCKCIKKNTKMNYHIYIRIQTHYSVLC